MIETARGGALIETSAIRLRAHDGGHAAFDSPRLGLIAAPSAGTR
jgi:hypothetical protein